MVVSPLKEANEKILKALGLEGISWYAEVAWGVNMLKELERPNTGTRIARPELRHRFHLPPIQKSQDVRSPALSVHFSIFSGAQPSTHL